MLGERPETADEWEKSYLEGEVWKIDDAIENKHVSGPQLIGARRAKVVLEDRKHGEAMMANAVSNQLSRKSLNWLPWTVGISIATAVVIALAQHYCK